MGTFMVAQEGNQNRYLRFIKPCREAAGLFFADGTFKILNQN
jgi:hypothetical protein